MDKDEFCEICNTASVRRALQRMGVPLDQAETLFDIIDSTHSGEVTFAGFYDGVKKVRGVPTSLDMKTMMVAVRNIYKQQVKLEKDSRNLQHVLLALIEDAQNNGNVIHLPPKDELESLLTVTKNLSSQTSFGDIKSPASARNGGARCFSRAEEELPSLWQHIESSQSEAADAATDKEAEALFSEPEAPSVASGAEGDQSISPEAMRDILPNAVPEDPDDPAPVLEEVMVGAGDDRSPPSYTVEKTISPHRTGKKLQAVIRRSASHERLPVVVTAKHMDERPNTVRLKLRDSQEQPALMEGG